MENNEMRNQTEWREVFVKELENAEKSLLSLNLIISVIDNVECTEKEKVDLYSYMLSKMLVLMRKW